MLSGVRVVQHVSRSENGNKLLIYALTSSDQCLSIANASIFVHILTCRLYIPEMPKVLCMCFVCTSKNLQGVEVDKSTRRRHLVRQREFLQSTSLSGASTSTSATHNMYVVVLISP